MLSYGTDNQSPAPRAQNDADYTLLVGRVPKAAGSALEICDRRRGHRGSRDEGRLTINADRILNLKDLNSPGGSRWTNRTFAWPKSRFQEWSRLPEPRPPQAGYWCSRRARRPRRLILLGTGRVMQSGSDLGYRTHAGDRGCCPGLLFAFFLHLQFLPRSHSHAPLPSRYGKMIS
jgi:hypothetical protein